MAEKLGRLKKEMDLIEKKKKENKEIAHQINSPKKSNFTIACQRHTKEKVKRQRNK